MRISNAKANGSIHPAMICDSIFPSSPAGTRPVYYSSLISQLLNRFILPDIDSVCSLTSQIRISQNADPRVVFHLFWNEPRVGLIIRQWRGKCAIRWNRFQIEKTKLCLLPHSRLLHMGIAILGSEQSGFCGSSWIFLDNEVTSLNPIVQRINADSSVAQMARLDNEPNFEAINEKIMKMNLSFAVHCYTWSITLIAQHWV